MHTEYSFLFNPSLNLNTTTNQDNTSNIYGRHVRFSGTTVSGQGIFVYKRPDVYGTTEIKNYIKTTTYSDSNDGDPYIQLIRYFDSAKLKAMKLRAADFAYLKDIGVYPINRLWILRRYPDNVVVPERPSDWGENAKEPISTVIGWMKDDDNSPMLTLSFGEIWNDTTEMIDQVLSRLLESEFDLNLKAGMSVPGWSQGILFGMLNAMGLSSDYSAENVPTGDPNVLRISKVREITQQGLKSDLNFKLETCYEQKYINGIDPGQAFLDITTNLLKMGTSDQKFVINANNAMVQSLVKKLNSPSTSLKGWYDLIVEFITAFITSINTFFESIKDIGAETREQDNPGSTTADIGSFLTSSLNTIVGASQVILNGTVSKYRWPLKGSIALMTGLPTTPWHLTIGNPYSPIVNLSNIHVSEVSTKFSNDLGFNDLPVRIDVNITASLGRPLGKQEIERLFNNGYKRIYAKTRIDEWAALDQRNSTVSADGITTSDAQANKKDDWTSTSPQTPQGTITTPFRSYNSNITNEPTFP